MPNGHHVESVSAQLERMLNSPPLVSSPSLCRFLRYIVEETLAGRSTAIKEVALGVQVFERGESFNPRLDPIVRVQARNLRARMAKYYAGPGSGDPIRIELPKGAYVPVFHGPISGTPDATEPEPAAASLAPRGNQDRRIFMAAVILIVVLAGIAAVWMVRTHAAPSRLAQHPAQHPAHHPAQQHSDSQPDSVAQDLYIRGRYVMDRQTEGSLREAVACFQQATARAPRFAAAHAGLADAYNMLSQFGYIAPREGMENARRAALKSIEIDPRLAEGHVSLAAVIEAYDWDWAAAEREYRRALELNPALPSAHLWYGMFLRDQERLQEAMPELRRAAQLEPFSALTNVNLAHGLMVSGNYAAALEQSLRAAEMAPDLVAADVMLSHAYRAAARTGESEAALARAQRLAADNPHALSLVACELVKLGKREDGLRLVREIERLARQRYVSPFDLGRVSLALGDEDRALGLFEEAFRQRSSGLIFLRKTDAPGGRNAPRFQALLDKVHFKG